MSRAKIAIIGAGPAGLRAGQLLVQEGFEVTIYEAKDRVGGRVHTVTREGGVVYEAGGEWIDADHHRVVDLLKEFGMEPEISRQWPGRVIWRGEERPEDQVWEDAEADAAAVHEAAAEICRSMKETPWENQELADLDLQTLDEFLDHNCTSQVGRWWVEAVQRSDEGEDTAQVGLLGWLVGYRNYLARESGDMSLYRIPGGGQALFEKMAKGLTVLLNRPVQSVIAGEEMVEVWAQGEMGFFDRVLITIPPGPLLELDLGEGLPIEKDVALDVLGSARAIKVAMRFRIRFWGEKLRLLTDLPCMQVWDGSRGEAPVLNAYICGDAAVRLIERSDPVGAVVRALAEILPEAQDEFVEGWLHDWITDPYAQGAFTSLAPGSVMASLPHLPVPAGRLHFAGEYTSRWTGFIEGALESAERAALEIRHAVEEDEE